MIKRLLQLTFVIALAFSLVFFVLARQFSQFLLTPLSVAKEGAVFMISPGTSPRKIASQLEKSQIISSSFWFLVCIGRDGAWNHLKAGEYLIKSGTTPSQLVEQLREGRVLQHALTIVPGWTFEQLLQAVNESPFLIHTMTGLTITDVINQLELAGVHPEGQFLPETYYFPLGTTDVAFLKRAKLLLDRKLKSLWQEPREETFPLKSPYEALILASIIEKETSVAEEYSDISGVYIRRLKQNMPLQADPTVIYGAGKNYTGILTTRLLLEPTPYNTYQKLGLPPTPIALPSTKALEAAFHPKAGDSLYFVAKKEGKGHIFSKTLEEHNKAVMEYRKAQAGLK